MTDLIKDRADKLGRSLICIGLAYLFVQPLPYAFGIGIVVVVAVCTVLDTATTLHPAPLDREDVEVS